MRVPAHKAGKVRKLYDWKCEKCDTTFEEMANQQEIDNRSIICPNCQAPADKLLSAPGVDSHAAAYWRR